MNAPLSRAAGTVASFVALLLIVPAAGMLFGEVDWGPGDFIVAGALLFGAGMAYVIGSRRVTSTKHRALVAVGVLSVAATVWAELAVGLFD